MKFNVTVQRIEFREHVFQVDAADRDAAFHAGLAEANGYDFHDSPVDSAEENVTAVVPADAGNVLEDARKSAEFCDFMDGFCLGLDDLPDGAWFAMFEEGVEEWNRQEPGNTVSALDGVLLWKRRHGGGEDSP